MRKVLTYFCSFLLIFFIIPAFCTITPSNKKEQQVGMTIESQQKQKNMIIKNIK